MTDQTATILNEIPVGVPKPHLSSSCDGETGMSWVKGVNRFEAILAADDHLTWSTKIDGTYGEGGDVMGTVQADRVVFYTAVKAFYGVAM